jgi:2-oxoglutarate ferredoxin oxidoreductase subunit alpha
MQATRGGGHGDFRNIVLAPASVQEMASLTMRGFDLADQYRMTAMILADGTIGQMMEPVTLETPTPTLVEKPWALTGTQGKREKNIITSLYLSPTELEKKNLSRFARYAAVQQKETEYEAFCMDDAQICLVAYGITARVSKNAVAAARAKGIRAGLIRPITLWPFPTEALRQAAKTVRQFLSVEMSMGQMMTDIELAIRCTRPVTLVSRVGGVIPAPEEVLVAIERAANEEAT